MNNNWPNSFFFFFFFFLFFFFLIHHFEKINSVSLFSGFLSETSGNYTSSFVLAGVAMVSASVILVYPIIYHRRQERSLKGLKTAFVGEKIIVNNNCDSDEKCIETKVPLISEN